MTETHPDLTIKHMTSQLKHILT